MDGCVLTRIQYRSRKFLITNKKRVLHFGAINLPRQRAFKLAWSEKWPKKTEI